VRHLCFFIFLGLCLSSCLTTESSYARVAPGIWRGVLVLQEYKVPVRDKDTVFVLHDQFREGELPFNFEVHYLDRERFYIEIINGSERIRLDSIQYGRDRSAARDTFNIHFPEFQTYLHAAVRGNVMQGEWILPARGNLRIPFYAHAGRDYRFTPLAEKPLTDLSGEWATMLNIGSEHPEKAIGEFKQKGNRLEGTFRTETGDYRFLEGTVQGRKFWLSCFDGSHAFLFAGSIKGDSLNGSFRSRNNAPTLWAARRDPNFRLGAADTLTRLKAGAGDIRFATTNSAGQTLQYPGPAFDGKVKIFTIMGTWCPNCRDEQNFLRDYLRENPVQAEKIAVVSFAFERNKTIEQANAQLEVYKQKMGIPFDMVYSGPADKAEAGKVFPMLNRVLAFPTMIMIDKNDKVHHIHTGFDGPATSKYPAFKQEFSAMMTELTNK
jgi:thiol-disulfide isomerase/thioredoxin